MKTLFITLFTVVTLALNVQTTTETMTATFTGFSEGTFYFEDSDELVHTFDYIDVEPTKKYNLLRDKSFEGKIFKVTYKSTESVNEEGEDYTVNAVTDLELIR